MLAIHLFLSFLPCFLLSPVQFLLEHVLVFVDMNEAKYDASAAIDKLTFHGQIPYEHNLRVYFELQFISDATFIPEEALSGKVHIFPIVPD